MKKIIAMACALSAFGFASHLVRAEDSANMPQGAADKMQSAADKAQGAADKMQGTDISNPGAAVSGETTTTHTDDKGLQATNTTKWKEMKTCTDKDGVTYYRGKKGFESCLSALKKSSKKEQMGGTTGSESENTARPDSSMNSGSTDTTKTDTATTPSSSDTSASH